MSDFDDPYIESHPQESRKRPWWQWVLVYPTIVVAFIPVVPVWFDKINELVESWANPDAKAQTELVRFMNENPNCVNSPFNWFETPEELKVDGTICETTGDVWLRVQLGDGQVVYHGVDISAFVENGRNLAFDQRSYSVFSSSNISGAAEKFLIKPNDREKENALRLVQNRALVICQKQVSNFSLMRHIRIGNQCFDEFIDTRNGFVTSTIQTPCRQSC